jgi:hypothetical protein
MRVMRRVCARWVFAFPGEGNGESSPIREPILKALPKSRPQLPPSLHKRLDLRPKTSPYVVLEMIGSGGHSSVSYGNISQLKKSCHLRIIPINSQKITSWREPENA